MDARGRGRGRGRGGQGGRGRGQAGVRAPVEDASVTRGRTWSSARSVAEESHADQAGSGGGVDAGVAGAVGVPAGAAGVPAGAAGIAAEGAQARDDRIADLLALLLERLPERVPAQAPVVPQAAVRQQGAADAPQGAVRQQGAAVAEELPSYLRMMEQLQRIGTGFFSGGAKPEEADGWRLRLERNFSSIRCPEGYRVDLAVHYLEGDAHLWWRGVTARRAQAEMTWEDFVREFNSKFFPQEALDRLERRFLELAQGSRPVREYEAEFHRLKMYGGHALDDEQAQVRRFLRGLRAELRNRCIVRSYVSVGELVEMAALIKEGLQKEVAVVIPTLPARKPQSGSGKGDKPTQDQKRK